MESDLLEEYLKSRLQLLESFGIHQDLGYNLRDNTRYSYCIREDSVAFIEDTPESANICTLYRLLESLDYYEEPRTYAQNNQRDIRTSTLYDLIPMDSSAGEYYGIFDKSLRIY